MSLKCDCDSHVTEVTDLSFLVSVKTGTASQQCVTSTQLREFRKSPYIFRKRSLGLMDESPGESIVDQGARKLVFEGRKAFSEKFVCRTAVPRSAGYEPRIEAFHDWLKRTHRSSLRPSQAKLIETIRRSVRQHADAGDLVNGSVVGRMVCATYTGLNCLSMLEGFHPDAGLVQLAVHVNLPFDQEWGPAWLAWLQHWAFARALVRERSGVTFPVHAIIVEKSHPYRCRLRVVPSDVLDHAEQENTIAMTRLRHCIETDRWPTLFEAIRPK